MDQYVLVLYLHELESNYDERIRLEQLRDASNPFHLREAKFQKLFRLSRSQAYQLLQDLDDPRLRQGTLPDFLKVFSALNFFASGSYQTNVGEVGLISLSQPSVSRTLETITKLILEKITPRLIKFPVTSEEIQSTKQEFWDIYNMPNTIGAIDGTHVAIVKPEINSPDAPAILFYNRKGYYSINCQIVVEANGTITSVNPNFPGSCHDSAIWKASSLYRHLEAKFIGGEENQWLLGDKGYQLLPWLMTPVPVPTSTAEINYNIAHTATRNIVENTIGRLKNKFRCLLKHRTLHYQPCKASEIIVACCTLYNICKNNVVPDDDESPASSEEDRDENPEDETNVTDRQIENIDYYNIGQEKRNAVISSHYS